MVSFPVKRIFSSFKIGLEKIPSCYSAKKRPDYNIKSVTSDVQILLIADGEARYLRNKNVAFTIHFALEIVPKDYGSNIQV